MTTQKTKSYCYAREMHVTSMKKKGFVASSLSDFKPLCESEGAKRRAMWLAGRVFRVSSGANCTGNGLIGAATASFSRYFSRERAENLRKINPKVSFPEANSIATELYDVVKQHGPITIPNTWAQAKVITLFPNSVFVIQYVKCGFL